MELIKHDYIDGLLAESTIWDGCMQRGMAWQNASSLAALVQTCIALGNQKRPPWQLDWRYTPPGIQINPDALQMLHRLLSIDRRGLLDWFQGFYLHPATIVANHFLDVYGSSLYEVMDKNQSTWTAADISLANAFSLEVRFAINSTPMQGIHKSYVSAASARLREALNYLSRLQAKHGDLLVFNFILRGDDMWRRNSSSWSSEHVACEVRKLLSISFQENFVGFIWKSLDFCDDRPIIDAMIFLSLPRIQATANDLHFQFKADIFALGRILEVPRSTPTGIAFPLRLNSGNAQARELAKAIVTQKLCDGYFFQKKKNGRQKFHGYGVDL